MSSVKGITIQNEEKKSSERQIKDTRTQSEYIYRKENAIEEDEFNLYQLGKKEIAIMHRNANRPHREPKKIEKSSDSINICPCCKNQIGDPFNTCDDPKDFSNCGIGVTLYFSSIKFIIFIMLFVSICIGSLNIYFSYKYTSELTEVCNSYYKIQNLTNQNYTEECKYYFTQKDEYFEYFEIYGLADTFFFRFSSVNVKDYRDLYHKINTEKNKSFEHSIINISLVNYICLIVVFLFNLFSIFYLFNKKNLIDYKNLTAGDYSIFLYNLNYAKKKFKKENKEIKYKRVKSKIDCKSFDEKSLTKSQLDIIHNENIKQIEQFKSFIKSVICKEMFGEELKIHHIVLCYKLEKLIKLHEKLEEIKKKIAKVKYDPKQIKMNEELEEDEKKYFNNFLCYIREEKLKYLEDKESKIKIKIKNIFDESQKNTLNYFAGCAIIIFDLIKYKEESLKKLPSNIIEYFIRCIKTIN